MNLKLKRCRSLPPLVEGKVYSYLKLVIDEIVWSKKSPGNVSVLASWWGENDSLEFKPIDMKSRSSPTDETEALYIIKTNKSLFQEYIRNCETLELVIVLESTNEIIGTARVFNLLDIFKHRPFSRYFPILNTNKIRIGDIHVVIQLSNTSSISEPKNSLTSGLTKLKRERKSLKHFQEDIVVNKSDYSSLDRYKKNYENVYDSILKSDDNQPVLETVANKTDPEVADKLVAQVIARAQRLRGIILRESQDDPLALSDNSVLEGLTLNVQQKKDDDFYKFITENQRLALDKLENRNRMLDILKSLSPASSLIELTSKHINENQEGNYHTTKHVESISRSEEMGSDSGKYQETQDLQTKASPPLNYVDSLRIVIEMLTLSPAGYRRVRSSCLSRDERSMTSITYFVHYDPIFVRTNDAKNKMTNRKIVKIFSRKQYEDVIYFNHKAIFNISKTCLRQCLPLKFKVYHRHLNQRSPTELGTGSMNITDSTTSKYLSTTQRVAVVNKGIKVAELKVCVELGCDGIHFGKEFVDAVLCEKENIPVIENSSVTSNDSIRYKTVSGTESKRNTAVSTMPLESVSNSSDSNLCSNKTDIVRQNNDNMLFKNRPVDNQVKDKVLLHGLIYISEGKDLPSLNTYLVCRAFWREDRAASGICLNTDKPFYNFHQLVPIFHGTEFLERTKNNFIIIEVYSKNNTGDTLIGIAKLHVHQFYVAYRDPLVLPHLTMSKYPVISVDGWVNVVDLVSRQYRGQILALVAVGTADQIALLEMTRGLRNSCVTPRTLQDCTDIMSSNHIRQPDYSDHQANQTIFANQQCHIDKYVIESSRNQECQTEITTVEETKTRDDCNTSDEDPLHTMIGQHCKIHHDVDVHHDIESNVHLTEKRLKSLQIPTARNNVLSLSDESSIDSPGENLPSAMYRSVGVGAEFNEETTTTVPQFPMPQQQESSVEHSDVDEIPVVDVCDGSFKATVEIECAYHLPMVKKEHETVEPSTYVTFQSAMDSVNGRGSNVVTNVCLRTCTPKWDWKCSTRLSRELVNNKDKRLILKIWRLYDPDKNVQVNHKKDIVIGIAAIDLSVFLVGFPVLCGWFNIINYTGKIIGQIRISITPLENLANMDSNNFVNPNPVISRLSSSHSEDNAVQNSKANDDLDVIPQFDTESISFLSHSLKQKLTELNEITMRLKTRLHDVTNNAFEEDFEAEFQIDSDAENEIETNEKKKNNKITEKEEKWPSIQEVPSNANPECSNHENASTKFSFNADADSNFVRHSNTSDYSNFHPPNSSASTYNLRSRVDYVDSSALLHKNLSSPNGSTSNEAYPTKGTKVHINHLLDKLSLQLGSHSKPPFPVQGNVMDLIDSLRYSHDSNASTKRTNSIPTQTETNVHSPSEDSEPPMKNTKISTIIREELVSEENNDDSTEYDELSRHLISSNVRHMSNMEKCTNPLFYDHLIPDVSSLAEIDTQSPENEAVKQLDSRYVENFNLTVQNGLQRLWNLPDCGKDDQESSSLNQPDSETHNFRPTPSGVSENLDGNVDVNAPQKLSNNNSDLAERNESETDSSNISLDKISIRSVREDDENVLTSSESSASIISRQAPDGGNPVEESSGSTVVNSNESNST